MRCRNVGGIDRVLRAGIGVILLVSGLALLTAGHDLGWTFAIVGVPALASAVLGFCPPYLLFGFSTAKPSAQCASGRATQDGTPR